MKTYVACLSMAAGLGWGQALAQDAGDVTERIRACSTLDQAAKLECLERLSREIAPARRPSVSPPVPGAADPPRWIISETTSPLDYSPVVVATGTSAAGPGAMMQLSIRCRGGRTELVVLAPTLVGPPGEYAVTYRVNGGDRIALPIDPPSVGKGFAFRGDAIRLLTSLPDRGEISLQIADRRNQTLQARYPLGDLSSVLGRLAAPCKWPSAARP